MDSGHYHDEDPTPKMTADQLQRSIERLTRVPERPDNLKPLVEPKRITDDQLQARIKHLYDDSLARREAEREEIARQMQVAIMKDATANTRVMSKTEGDAMVNRLYEESIARKNQNMETLYTQETSHYVRSSKKLSSGEQTEVASRLYQGGMERERSKRIALYEKFVVARQQPAAQRSRAHIEAMADKMTKGEGSTS